MTHTAAAAVLTLVVAGSAACSGASAQATSSPLSGTGQFTFAPEGRRPIDVFYAGSAGDMRDAPIVVVMHGQQRNASDYRDAWTRHVQRRPGLVIAPRFSQSDFPGAARYNVGGLADPGGDRAVDYIEPLFREVVRRIGGHQNTFDMFGHSAGAQFVHRYVTFMPHAPVGKAVAANAGWYTLPDQSEHFPYGLRGAPAPSRPRGFLQRRLIVMLGANDVGDESLRDDAAARRQGDTRLARGFSYFLAARRAAGEAGVDLAWSLQVVPGIDHDHDAMSDEAAELLLGP